MSFGGELFLRSDNEKRGYKGPLLEALPGDLIVSKIRAAQGSICVIGDEYDQVAVSPEYPVYTPDCERVHPGYLALVLRTPGFLAQLAGAASGNTTKRRIRPAFFESRHIPLPPLNEQRVIVAAHRTTLARAADLEREAEAVEARAMEAFEAALGFGSPVPLPERPVFIASFKDLDRWSHEGILRATLSLGKMEPRFPIVELVSARKPLLPHELCDAPPSCRRGFSHGAGGTDTTEVHSASSRTPSPMFEHRRAVPVSMCRTGGDIRR